MAISASTIFPQNAVSIKTASGPLSYDLATRETHTIELDPDVHELDPATPGVKILALLNKVGPPRTVKQPIYFMLQKRQFPRFINLGGAYTAGNTTITVAAADVTKIKRGYYILNTITRVMWRVNGTPAASMPVEVAGSVADASGITASDELLILGYRGAEFDTTFSDLIRLPSVIFNYVGEIQKTYEITQYEGASGHLPGHDPLAVLRMDKLQEARLDVEWGILFDQRAKTIRSDSDGRSRVVFTTGGADSFMTANETDLGGSLTEAKLNTAFRSLRRHGPDERWGLAAPLFMEKLDAHVISIGAGAPRNLGVTPTEIGSAITRVKYGGLVINFMEHPLFDDASSTNDNSIKEHCWVFNLSDFALTTMNSDQMGFFKWFLRVETPGTRGKMDQLVVNYGVKMALPETHGRLYNVT